jgi:hypothetical protein
MRNTSLSPSVLTRTAANGRACVTVAESRRVTPGPSTSAHWLGGPGRLGQSAAASGFSESSCRLDDSADPAVAEALRLALVSVDHGRGE